MVNLGEVFRSCSNRWVAEAALASLGGVVGANVQAAAERHGVSGGVIVGELVQEFRQHSCPAIVKSIEQAMHRSELPILTGLQHVLAHALIRRALTHQVEPAAKRDFRLRKYA